MDGIILIVCDVGGYFVVDGEVNGIWIWFFFDIGVSVVVLIYFDVLCVGFNVGDLFFIVLVLIVNGCSLVVFVRIDELFIGGYMLRNICGYVVCDGVLEVSFLGMIVLDCVCIWWIEGD